LYKVPLQSESLFFATTANLPGDRKTTTGGVHYYLGDKHSSTVRLNGDLHFTGFIIKIAKFGSDEARLRGKLTPQKQCNDLEKIRPESVVVADEEGGETGKRAVLFLRAF